jgi:hypothetical protein
MIIRELDFDEFEKPVADFLEGSTYSFARWDVVLTMYDRMPPGKEIQVSEV